jgi:hypothetical protein
MCPMMRIATPEIRFPRATAVIGIRIRGGGAPDQHWTVEFCSPMFFGEATQQVDSRRAASARGFVCVRPGRSTLECDPSFFMTNIMVFPLRVFP